MRKDICNLPDRLSNRYMSFVESAHRLYSEIASEAMPISTTGDDPKYGEWSPPPPNAAPDDDGYPNGPRCLKEITKSTREDAIGLMAIVCARNALIYSERLEYSHTDSGRKRLADRTFSDYSRTIAELRRVNLGLGDGDCFPIWLPEIKHIASRTIRKKRQAPWSTCASL